MNATNTYNGGENFDLRSILLAGRNQSLAARTVLFDDFVDSLRGKDEFLQMRCISSAADREVRVVDPMTKSIRAMLMFGSNNYLGLANHPRVRDRVKQAIDEYGVGIGGPPLLNGYTALHRELEERLAALKGTEDAMIFSSGYGANVGLVAGLAGAKDLVICDAYSHASFLDGITLAGARSLQFKHNDIAGLQHLLNEASQDHSRGIFVGVEGVYSMDGDLAPLDRIAPLCASYGATLLVDDAHGTGVMGRTGRGTAEHFGLDGRIPLTMGTFSKTFAVTGGFIAGTRSVINYLRFFARPYMFSASLSPVTTATVLAGLDVLEAEPWLLSHLRDNVGYAASGLRRLGFNVAPQAAIIPLRAPHGMDIRRAARSFHKRSIFVNSVEYPAVPISQQRFRISLMATHTREDIDRLVQAVAEVWAEAGVAGPEVTEVNDVQAA